MVSALHHLGERAFTKDFHDFISIGYMVTHLDSVVALIVVKYWISLVFTVLSIILCIFSLFLIESLATLNIDIFHHFQFLISPLGDQPREVYHVKFVIR